MKCFPALLYIAPPIWTHLSRESAAPSKFSLELARCWDRGTGTVARTPADNCIETLGFLVRSCIVIGTYLGCGDTRNILHASVRFPRNTERPPLTELLERPHLVDTVTKLELKLADLTADSDGAQERSLFDFLRNSTALRTFYLLACTVSDTRHLLRALADCRTVEVVSLLRALPCERSRYYVPELTALIARPDSRIESVWGLQDLFGDADVHVVDDISRINCNLADIGPVDTVRVPTSNNGPVNSGEPTERLTQLCVRNSTALRLALRFLVRATSARIVETAGAFLTVCQTPGFKRQVQLLLQRSTDSDCVDSVPVLRKAMIEAGRVLLQGLGALTPGVGILASLSPECLNEVLGHMTECQARSRETFPGAPCIDCVCRAAAGRATHDLCALWRRQRTIGAATIVGEAKRSYRWHLPCACTAAIAKRAIRRH